MPEHYYKIIGATSRFSRIVILGFLLILLRFLFLDILFPINIDIEYSTLVLDRDSTVMHAFLTSDDKWRMKTELHEITPRLEKAIVFKEDKYFYYHFGINPAAIIRAGINNLLNNYRTSGASTITMQVARLLEPKERSYVNKIFEMFRAVQLEWHYSKSEILQLYLNLVPYGGNIEGVKAASILYFDKAPNHLSIAEVTTLAIIPNRPNTLQLGRNNLVIETERNKWLNRFKESELFDSIFINDALDEALDAKRMNGPKLAPHFCRRVKSIYPDKPNIQTSIDLETQLKIEKLTKDYIRSIASQNIHNAAVLVINNRSHCVEAYVGSADFNNVNDGGQVDGIRAVRSPGSTLKPLLYAIAIEQGIATPKSIISDVPVNFGGYEPENYDGKFYGNVSLEFALANSLNVPAVKILRELGPEKLVDRLSHAGFKQIEKDKNVLGLSTVLGGCGTTLEELTVLYSAFSDTGIQTEYKWLYGDTSFYHKQIMSPESAFMITEVLTQVTRPDLPMQWHNSANLPKVAWKTGTSYGRKDAWSIGYNKNYTIGVWVGNFSGQGVPDLSGATTAAPLLFNVFNIIDYGSEKEWYTMPDGLDFRYVCSHSGDTPAEFCSDQVMDYFIPFVSSAVECKHMKNVWIPADSSVSYCSECLPQDGYIKALYNNYKPEIITYFEMNQIKYDKIPPHNPDCERVFAENAPIITSPVENTEYFINKQDSMQVMLKCNVANNVDTIYWFVNNRFYKKCGATDKVFFSPGEGRVKISCTDDKGRNTDINIDVREIAF